MSIFSYPEILLLVAERADRATISALMQTNKASDSAELTALRIAGRATTAYILAENMCFSKVL